MPFESSRSSQPPEGLRGLLSQWRPASRVARSLNYADTTSIQHDHHHHDLLQPTVTGTSLSTACCGPREPLLTTTNRTAKGFLLGQTILVTGGAGFIGCH